MPQVKRMDFFRVSTHVIHGSVTHMPLHSCLKMICIVLEFANAINRIFVYAYHTTISHNIDIPLVASLKTYKIPSLSVTQICTHMHINSIYNRTYYIVLRKETEKSISKNTDEASPSFLCHGANLQGIFL